MAAARVIAGSLAFSGGFALFLAATGEFLPHDIHYLGMSAADLCDVADCRIVDFMIHDRAAFGGTLVGLGVLYGWLTLFPLARGHRWAWWTWLVSATAGFASFLGYLGYGYLDTWHGVGTLLLLPVFVVGLVRSRALLDDRRLDRSWWRPSVPPEVRTMGGWGRVLLLGGAAATAIGGLTILWVGVTDTFVPEDLEFIGLSADQLRDLSPRLVPLLAHDRVGFGGGVFTMGLTTLLCLWFARPSRSLHQAIALAGGVSVGSALVVHIGVTYTDLGHLLPALGAMVLLVSGLALSVVGRIRAAAGAPRAGHRGG